MGGPDAPSRRVPPPESPPDSEKLMLSPPSGARPACDRARFSSAPSRCSRARVSGRSACTWSLALPLSRSRRIATRPSSAGSSTTSTRPSAPVPRPRPTTTGAIWPAGGGGRGRAALACPAGCGEAGDGLGGRAGDRAEEDGPGVSVADRLADMAGPVLVAISVVAGAADDPGATVSATAAGREAEALSPPASAGASPGCGGMSRIAASWSPALSVSATARLGVARSGEAERGAFPAGAGPAAPMGRDAAPAACRGAWEGPASGPVATVPAGGGARGTIAVAAGAIAVGETVAVAAGMASRIPAWEMPSLAGRGSVSAFVKGDACPAGAPPEGWAVSSAVTASPASDGAGRAAPSAAAGGAGRS